MFQFLSSVYSAAGAAWCKMFHPDPMWPVNGEYQCRVCQRRFRVAWEGPALAHPQHANDHRKAAARPDAIAPATLTNSY